MIVKIQHSNSDPLRVSDHAVLRYLERAMDLNIEVVRAHIASVCGTAAACRAVCVRAEGLRFEIADKTVTTVKPDHQLPARNSQLRSQQRLERA